MEACCRFGWTVTVCDMSSRAPLISVIGKRVRTGWLWEKDAPPLIVVEDMLAAPLAPLPPLTQIMRVPFFVRGGELVVENGYHAAALTPLLEACFRWFADGSKVRRHCI
jgi:hypothetical protein